MSLPIDAFFIKQGNFSSTTGLVTLGMMLLGGQVFQKYGWGTAAKATPVVLLITGVSLIGKCSVRCHTLHRRTFRTDGIVAFQYCPPLPSFSPLCSLGVCAFRGLSRFSSSSVCLVFFYLRLLLLFLWSFYSTTRGSICSPFPLVRKRPRQRLRG